MAPSCSESGIKTWGVNEGFAKIVAHYVMSTNGARPPTADNVAGILTGYECSIFDAYCAHDLGNLVFKAYKRLLDDPAITVSVFGVYRSALNKLSTGDTLADLHKKVREVLVKRMNTTPRGGAPLEPDPFSLLDWLRALYERGIPITISNIDH